MVDIQIRGTRDEVQQIADADLPVPLKGNMDEGKRLWEIDFPTLEAAGFRIASYPGLIRYSIVRAVKDALAHLQKEGSTVAIRDRMADVKEYFDVSLALLCESPFDGPMDVPERPAQHHLDYRTHFERRMRMHAEPVYRSEFQKR